MVGQPPPGVGGERPVLELHHAPAEEPPAARLVRNRGHAVGLKIAGGQAGSERREDDLRQRRRGGRGPAALGEPLDAVQELDEALAFAPGQALALVGGTAADQRVQLDEPFQIASLLSLGQPHGLLPLAGAAPIAEGVRRYPGGLERLGGVFQASLHFAQPAQTRAVRRLDGEQDLRARRPASRRRRSTCRRRGSAAPWPLPPRRPRSRSASASPRRRRRKRWPRPAPRRTFRPRRATAAPRAAMPAAASSCPTPARARCRAARTAPSPVRASTHPGRATRRLWRRSVPTLLRIRGEPGLRGRRQRVRVPV